MLRPLFAIALLTAATAAAAEPAMMLKETIRETFTGSLLEIDTPAGTKIPVRFSDDGLVSGEAGELASYLGSARDRGRWWVAGDRLCVKWFRWFDAEARCLSLRRDGDRIFWRTQEGDTGTATIAERAKPVVKPVIQTARAPRARQVGAAETATEPAAVETPAEAESPARDTAAAPVTEPAPESMPMQFAGAAAFGPAPRFSEPARAPQPIRVPARQALAQHQDPASQEPVSQEPVSEAPAIQSPAVQTSEAVRPPQQAASQPTESQDTAPAKAWPARRTTASMAAATAAATAVTPSFRVVRVDEDDVLNVRRGPSEYSEPVAGIPPEGRGVRIVGRCLESWCPIQHGRVKGWVNRYYLAEETVTVASPPLPPLPGAPRR